MTELDKTGLEAAKAAFSQAESNPNLVPCSHCAGKGHQHGYGEDGADPDWCTSCGGGCVELVDGEEDRPLREAISAYLSTTSAGVTEEQVEASCAAFTSDWSHLEEFEKEHYRKNMRAALEASRVAPVSQKEAVAVGYVTQDVLAELAAGNIGGYIFPKGTLRPENEIALYASPAPAVEPVGIKARVAEFAQAILHGDDEHRGWLLEAAEAFNEGTPLPMPRGKGTAPHTSSALHPTPPVSAPAPEFESGVMNGETRFAWLVECFSGRPAKYLSGFEGATIMGTFGWFPTWTTDHAKAIRFERERDAETIAAQMEPSDKAKAVEHGWLATPVSAPMGVVEEQVEAACAKYARARYGGARVWPRDFSPKEIIEGRKNMRAALEAAPTIAVVEGK